MSQIIFNASVIPAPKNITTEINKIIFEYLWNGKRDRIKRNTIIGEYEIGGIKMVDTQSIIDSLHIKWVQRLLSAEDAAWKILPTWWLNFFGKDYLIFRMNFNNLKELINVSNAKTVPIFYQQIINSWLKIKTQNKAPANFAEIRKEVIWGNKNITFKNRPIIFKNWINDGIIYVNDLLNEKRKFDQQYLYNKMTTKSNWFSDLSMLLRALPKAWKNILDSKISCSTMVRIDKSLYINCGQGRLVDIVSVKNKVFYKILTSHKVEKPYVERKWNIIFDLRSFNWRDVWIFIYVGLRENKIKQFRFKVTHFILPCGQLLYKWKLKDNSECLFCNEIDTYEHLFFECRRLNFLWKKVQEIFNCLGIQNIELSLKTLVLGYKIKNEDYHWINEIFTIVCFIIFKSFCMKQDNKTVNIYALCKKELEYRGKVIERINKSLFVKINKFIMLL